MMRASSKCMYLEICSCLPPTPRLAIPPSSAPQLTLTLILGGDDMTVMMMMTIGDHVVSMILIQSCVVPPMVLILWGNPPPRLDGGWSPQHSSGSPLSNVQPPPLDPSCLQPIPCFLCTCLLPRLFQWKFIAAAGSKSRHTRWGAIWSEAGSEMESVMFHLRTAASLPAAAPETTHVLFRSRIGGLGGVGGQYHLAPRFQQKLVLSEIRLFSRT